MQQMESEKDLLGHMASIAYCENCGLALIGTKRCGYCYPGVSIVDTQMQMSKEQRFRNAGKDITERLIAKDKEYGSATEKVNAIIKVLYPSGVSVNQIQDFLIIVRILDKICRISNYELSDESHKDAMFDIAGYGLIGYVDH